MSASPAHLAELAALLLVIGGFAGVLAGLFGVGGGIVLVPAFYYAFASLGYDGPQIMQICLASSLATIVFTSARSLQGHHARGAVDWTVLRGWAPGLAIGALLAVLVPTALAEAVFRTDLEWRWASLAIALVTLPTLLWRRTRPLATTTVGFATMALAMPTRCSWPPDI